MRFKADTLDDALGAIIRRLLSSGQRIRAGKGAAREFMGVLVEISDPRARFSRTEDRATLFSCLGETLWYLSGTDDLRHIEYYIPNYRKFIGASTRATRAPGAYGPRLFGGGQESQMANLIGTLKEKLGKSDTRQAVAQIFDKADLRMSRGDVPCTTTIQFLPRRDRLHIAVTMRSNDIYRGFPHDVFAFTFLQEIVARQLGLELGTYSHFVGSLHLYEDDIARARDYLAEGWQTPMSMPPMPSGDPQTGLGWLLKAEAAIRSGSEIPSIKSVDPYWIDLARILSIKALVRRRALREIVQIKQEMASDVYGAFIRGREIALQKRVSAQADLPGLDVTATKHKAGSN